MGPRVIVDMTVGWYYRFATLGKGQGLLTEPLRRANLHLAFAVASDTRSPGGLPSHAERPHG
jgi:hypothetical protein